MPLQLNANVRRSTYIGAMQVLSFAAMPRSLNTMHAGPIAFPAETEMRAVLGPEWLFGAGADQDSKRFAVANSKGVSLFFNANTGRWTVRGGELLPPLRARASVSSETDTIEVIGNVASYRFIAQSYEQIAGVGNALVYALPALLNAYLQFPPIVEYVTAHTAGIERGYEVWTLQFYTPIVTEAGQISRATEALDSMPIFAVGSQRRLQAGLIYLHRAARLADAGHTRWEFLAESVLNLAKSLESLFPPKSPGRSRDPIRRGLLDLGLPSALVEAWFIPALLLRSELDVAHVRLSLPDRDQIAILSRYAEGALEHFRELFRSLTKRAATGDNPVEAYSDTSGSQSTRRLLERIGQQLDQYKKGTAEPS